MASGCSNNDQCGFGNYCNSGGCTAFKTIGSFCTNSYECGIGNTCAGLSCSEQYSGQLGDKCSYYEENNYCSIGNNLTCLPTGYCGVYQRTLGTCGADGSVECNDDFEYCDCDSLTCKPIQQYGNQNLCYIANQVQKACLEQNLCVLLDPQYSVAYYNKTCGVTHCPSQMCDAIAYCYDSEYPCAPIPQYCAQFNKRPFISPQLSDSYFGTIDEKEWPIYATSLIAVGGSIIIFIIFFLVIRRIKKTRTKHFKSMMKHSDEIHMTTMVTNTTTPVYNQPVSLDKYPNPEVNNEYNNQMYPPPQQYPPPQSYPQQPPSYGL
ncbi:hypothetical protein DLAC_01113 [Tieghemostelium lacteum]|uniref:Uncharacterized protein n=1 Tax=Tieghemostelium lacteum TaxID=361077 RepID=A0A152A7S0_TIELA|nr:hypothetical protein DLAC_01113 [Tieghemostelium lacteum]|eukprot:KYR02282.1 hypothetical protein DLAC_01113 [Tieghemostelium lacteum]